MSSATSTAFGSLRPPAAEWYAIYTRSNYEKRVASELAERELTVYLPTLSEVHQWKDRRTQVEVPVFKGYVFARFTDSADAKTRVLRTAGVVAILGSSGRITPVPDSEIEAVRKVLAAPVHCHRHACLREGSWVRVRRGPLQGLEGLFLRRGNGNKLLLSLTLLSQAIATEIDARDVEILRYS